MSYVVLGGFHAFAETRADKAQALKVMEESGEVVDALKSYAGTSMRNDDYDAREARCDLLDECADVCQAVANLLDGLGVADEEWEAARDRVYGRNLDRGRF